MYKFLVLLMLLSFRVNAFNVSDSWNAGPYYFYKMHNVPPFASKIIKSAMQEWMDASNVVFLKGTSENSGVVIDIYWDKTGKIFDWMDLYLAYTTVIPSAIKNDPYPLRVVIYINSFNYRFSNKLTLRTPFSLKTLMLHELGHAIGLNHVQDQTSIMCPIIPIGEEKTLSSDDIAGAAYIYGVKQ